MVMISIYTLIYIYFILFDLLPIIQNKYNKLFAFNLIIIFLGFLIVVLVGLDIKVPNPNNLIENIVKGLTG